ncbi:MULTISPECIES: hypothetical protein [unclassified Variovorax]
MRFKDLAQKFLPNPSNLAYGLRTAYVHIRTAEINGLVCESDHASSDNAYQLTNAGRHIVDDQRHRPTRPHGLG